MNFRYKSLYDHEHCLEASYRVFLPFPLLLLNSHNHATFFAISRQIRFHKTCD
ncbi:hypothetical protein T07_4417 [Trichinella nelsoni]|uniref:Uncharacterized protein n=1 Tax=Trichinella nelsoni TaxID=6336 RepID=A0A0V0RCD3_9BILA|nr:hypothetical protein T07_4417 [Trichinella nelsoni]